MTNNVDKKTRTEMLKQLREHHSVTFSRTQELLKSQKQIQQAISKAIEAQPRTVPEVAAATGAASESVLWWLSTMKKYGVVIEDGMQDDYPLYKLVEVKK
jgi:predicted transcriptional regulator